MKRFVILLFALVELTSGVRTMAAKSTYAVYNLGRPFFYFDDYEKNRVGVVFPMTYSMSVPGWMDIKENTTMVQFDYSFANYKPDGVDVWCLWDLAILPK